jgi:preprotein translocase subunit SecF
MSFFRDLYQGETHVEFVGRRKLWFALSAALLLVSLGSIMLRTAEAPCARLISGLNCGIEFKGGVEIKAPLGEGPLAGASGPEITSEMRSVLTPFGAADAQIQVAGEGADREILVQTPEVADPEQQEGLRAAILEATGASPGELDSQRIGAKWGEEITDKAIRALVIFLLVIVAFMSWKFEWKMAIGAIVALGHDIVITAGIYSLVGFQVTPATVVALLTILGYSLYDTVVVYDRVDEEVTHFATPGKMTYEGAANKALNTVLGRSINTSLTTLLPTGALLFVGVGLLGASTLQDLALALMVGVLAGTYSSIFVATPVLTILKEREPKYRGVREKVLRTARTQETAEEAEAPAPTHTAAGESTRPKAQRPPARAASGSKKAKRRKKKKKKKKR